MCRRQLGWCIPFAVGQTFVSVTAFHAVRALEALEKRWQTGMSAPPDSPDGEFRFLVSSFGFEDHGFGLNPRTDTNRPVTTSAHPRHRAASYIWRLLLLIPALAATGIGWWKYSDVPPGGTVTAVKLTTKPGPVGQVREAYDTVKPSTPDLYLKIFVPGREVNTRTFTDQPIGNGVTWNLESPFSLLEIKKVEVWDDDAFGDTQLDNVNMEGWSAEGQTFRIELQGEHPRPPEWALPLASAGATLAAVILLRFVWDQVV